jgi:hypothetical protein
VVVFGIGVVGLEGWVSNKLGKGGNEGSFVVWCWKDFGAIL